MIALPLRPGSPLRGGARTFLFLWLPVSVLAQMVRPIDPGGGGSGGGVIIGPGPGPGPGPGGGAGGPIIVPPPGGGGGITPPNTSLARIVTDPGAVVGASSTAVALPPVLPATPGVPLSVVPDTYRWTVTGARIVGGATSPRLEFLADAPGAVTLTATIGANGTAYTATAQVTAIPASMAGAMTAPAAVAASTTSAFEASVPPAANNDRTFRWAVTGDAAIATGQGTNRMTFRPGSPGLKEISCAVSMRNLTTITLRSYVVVTGSGPASEVNVVQGVGDGTYRAGSIVDIFALPPAPGKVFDRWEGDLAALNGGALARSIPHGVITVPPGGATLTATYRDAPEWEAATEREFNPQRQVGTPATSPAITSTLIHHVPAGARGLVFLLHPTGGQASDWFSGAEAMLSLRALVAAGYGVAALNSVDRVNAAWSPSTTLATNLDALNHVAALEKFARDHGFAADRPIFFAGLATGADAGLRFAEFLSAVRPARPVRGVVLFGAEGSEMFSVTSRIPQFFALAANDPHLEAAGNATARANAQLMAGRGIPANVAATSVAPVYPDRFRALSATAAAFTAQDAMTVWDALQTAGVLDGNHYVKSLPTTDALKALLPPALQARAADVAAQLAIANASQAVSVESTARVIGFLDARVAGVPANAPARLINLSTRGQVAHIADSFTLGFTLTGTERATVLVRVAGPALARFGVPAAHGAPRLEIYRGQTLVVANEGWDQPAANGAQVAAASTAVNAFAFAAGARDAAVVLQLEPGNYSAVVKGVNGTTGEALAEIYDVSRNGTRLRALSALARVNAAGQFVLPGMVLQGGAPRTLLLRAIGPGLTDVGLPASLVLGDPRLTVVTGNNVAVDANNNWGQDNPAVISAAAAAAGAFPLRAASADAALVRAFPPGAYTLQATALAGAAANPAAAVIGTVLVEISEVP